MSYRLERIRQLIQDQYKDHPTGCGGSFDELLCYEIHEQGMTFNWLADKWGITVTALGELILDHCRGLEKDPTVNHKWTLEAKSDD